MRTTKATEFFVHGHQCQIKNKSRELYVGYIDGDEIARGNSIKRVRDELITDASYRVETELDFWDVCNAVDNFIDSQRDRDGNPLWVYTETIIEAITPNQQVGPAYKALFELEHQDVIESGDICMKNNVENMWRARC